MDKNGKSQVVRDKGDLTAYATAIEARFSADLVFKKPKKDNEKEDEDQIINNKPQNFIYRKKRR